jgi:hypothetical protein
MNEKQLTKAVVDLLQACGWYVIRTHTPGQFSAHKGVTDLIAIDMPQKTMASQIPGQVAFIELKGPRSKTYPEQIRFIDEMRARGLTAFIADDIETVIETLNLKVLV